MLLIFGTHGAPGATTSAIFTAAMWTAEHGSVGLIDGDPTGGTLAAHLRLLQDPGVASLITRRHIDRNTLLECSQNVLVEKLQVAPLPTSPQGSSLAAQRLVDRGEDLAMISKSMPVIIDAGRAYFGTPMANLVPHASAVILVFQSAHLPAMAALQNYRQMLGLDAVPPAGGPPQSSDSEAEDEDQGEDQAEGQDENQAEASTCPVGLVSVGPQYFSSEELREHVDLPVIASFPYDHIRAYNYVDTMLAINRQSKRFLESAKQAAEAIWDFAYSDAPPMFELPEDLMEDIHPDDPFAMTFQDPASDAAEAATVTSAASSGK